jgi:hypothetical protein
VCKGRRKEGGGQVEQVRHSQQTPAPAINIRTGVTEKPELQEVPYLSLVLLIGDFYPECRIRIFPSRIWGQKGIGSRIRKKEIKYF